MTDSEGDGETTPLMGTGKVSLTDPEQPPASEALGGDESLPSEEDGEEEEEEETIISKVSKAKKKKKAKSADWHDDEEEGMTAVIVKSPMKHCMLHFFHWLEAFAIISCLGVLTTQILPLVVFPLSELGFLQCVLRIYVSLFSVIFILVELRLPLGFLQKSHLLQTYFSRGFLYTFLAVIGMEEAYSGRIDDMVSHATDAFHVAWAPLFMEISSWVVFAIGCFYMLSGLCCLQVVRDNLHDQHKKEVETYKSLK